MKDELTEEIFGWIWIVCWFVAIWVYHLQLFLTGLFALILGLMYYNSRRLKELEDTTKCEKQSS